MRKPAPKEATAEKKDFLAMCWKCANVVEVPSKKSPGAFEIIGCKAESRIHSFDDAQKLCPIREKLGKTTAEADTGLYNIYRREYFEGEEIKRTLLRDGLNRKAAVCLLSQLFDNEMKVWDEKYLMVEKSFEFRKGYYFFGIPVDHDRCLRVEMVEASRNLPEL